MEVQELDEKLHDVALSVVVQILKEFDRIRGEVAEDQADNIHRMLQRAHDRLIAFHDLRSASSYLELVQAFEAALKELEDADDFFGINQSEVVKPIQHFIAELDLQFQ